jgi:hypothetical protein
MEFTEFAKKLTFTQDAKKIGKMLKNRDVTIFSDEVWQNILPPT